MPIDYKDPRVLKYLLENYEREDEKRLIWFTKNRRDIEDAAKLNRPPKDYNEQDTPKERCRHGMLALERFHKNFAVNRRKKFSLDGPVLGISQLKDENTEIFPNTKMKPIEPEILKILSQSRNQYLKVRNRKNPDEKYYYSETSNGEYGWKVQESMLNRNVPKYGVCSSIEHGHSRSGPQPDPKHYNLPAGAIPMKCSF